MTFRLIAIGLGLAVALGVIEIALRLAGWPAPGLYVQGKGPLELREPGRNGGAFPPSVRGELRHYDYSVDCNVNSLGFRDADVGPKKRGEWRIGFLGDSFTLGVGVQEQDRFSDVFAGEIRNSQPNVTVLNLSAPLCGTACEREMLNRASESYQLDEVVLAFYGGNDLEDNSSWYANASAKQPPREAGFANTTKDWLRRHSRLATFVWVAGIRGWATFRPPGIYARADLDRYWPDTERSLQLLLATVGTRRFTILYLPSPPEWDDSVWQIMRTRYNANDDGRHLVRDALADWSRREGLTFLDATQWLQKCAPAKDCVFPVDPHWTAKAHSLVGQGLVGSQRWTTSAR